MDVWEEARRRMDGLPGEGGLNIAYEAVDRHVAHGDGDRVAFRFIDAGAAVRNLTYADLSRASNRFANALRRLGLGAGDAVFSFAGRIPELYIAALGTLKARAVFSALYANFGEEPVRTRLTKGNGKLLLTTAPFYRADCGHSRRAATAAPRRHRWPGHATAGHARLRRADGRGGR